jgi:alanyl-tRNA synthetase
MLTDKQVKKQFKAEASKNPDRYYATSVLKDEGFMRKQCACGTFFWTVDPDRTVCGDPSCSGGFNFFEKSPVKKELDYIGVWREFAKLFRKLGYTPIPRYPVVARWRDDEYWVGASIYDFQPYVVSGEVKPPANPLVVPQFCLRFNDIDNVGITGAHYTGFVMIGQHAFMPPEKWDQAKYFHDIHTWLKQGLGLPNEEIIFHEDAWAGGGNFGPCMEYFSRGLELGNQVYMMFEKTTSGSKELNLKVLDMGMGHERNAWFSKATSTSYETTFPDVVKKLYEITGIKPDNDLMKRFLPYSSYLNIDEVENIDKVWNDVAQKVKIKTKELKEKILPLAALYSVAEHSRSALFALNDGALPSNVGGGYNLRVILRRAFSFIDQYGWKISLPELCRWHASYLKPLFPELSENLDTVTRILDVEKAKYEATKQKSKQIVSQIIKKDITERKLLELYDSMGIPPDIIQKEALQYNKKVKIPEDFYAKVAALHEKTEQEHATVKVEKLNLAGLQDTEVLYFDDYKRGSFNAKVLKIIDNNVVLDKTLFYPTSGGQIHDTGTINNEWVIEVFKQGSIIVHVLEKKPSFKEGDTINGTIDIKRRTQLTQHHTATHIVNVAARKVLGSHINQAGAKKTMEKSHLDVTHYQSISDDELKRIEEEANKIVKQNLPVQSLFLSRDEAEKKYGMSIYQGGAVPGRKIRIIDIKGVDIEACGGTHLHTTAEAGTIKIEKSTKIQDGICRITFTAGKAAEASSNKENALIMEAVALLGVKPEQLPSRSEELFQKWKKARKAAKKNKLINPKEMELVSNESYDGDILAKTAAILKTQPENITKTIKRFLKEIEEFKNAKPR